MPRRFLVLLAVLLPALLLVWKLDYAPFWNPDEGRYSAASYEMAFGFDGAAPDWVVPHLNTVARLNKPPLIYWTSAALFRAFGPSEIAGRLPSALAALVVLVLLLGWGRAAFGDRAGAGAALVWGTAAFPLAMARVANADMLLCASMAIACFGIFWSIESQKRALFGLVAGVGMALALLSKGPVGVALPLLVGAVYLTLGRSWNRAPWGALVLAIFVAIGLGAPWYFAVEARRPGWLHTFIFAENLGRFSGKQEFHASTPFWFYLPVIAVGMLPWTGFFLASLRRVEEMEARAAQTRLFLAVWAVLITLFFSLSGTKLASYVLPAFPALALWTGASLARFESWSRAARFFALGFTVLVNGVVGIVVALKPGVLLSEKIVPRAVGAPWALALVVVLTLGSVLLILGARRGDGRSILASQGASALMMASFLVLLAGQIARYEDGSALMRELRPRLRPEDRIAGYLSFLPGAVFYAGRPVTFFRFGNSSGLDEKELARSPYFLAPERWDEFSRRPGRVFALTEGPMWRGAAGSFHLWGRNNDWFLYGSTLKPADFDCDFHAPRKRPNKIRKP